MTLDEAKAIVAKTDGCVIFAANLTRNGSVDVTLDGIFSIEEIEAVLVQMRAEAWEEKLKYEQIMWKHGYRP